MNNPLVVQNLTKTFITKSFLGLKIKNSFTAVDNISFLLREGEFLGFLGPNGAGKTTTIQMLLDLLTPTSGKIEYFGKNLLKDKKVMQNIAYASGYMRLPSSLTVEQVLIMYGMLYNTKHSILKEKVKNFIKAFNLERLADKKCMTLSSGQTTSVLLARTFMVDPKIVLLDEPTAALDPESAQRIRDFITMQNKQNGVSILFTSHNMPEVAQLCDRVIVLKDGKIIADNSPDYLSSTVAIAKLQLIIQDGLEHALFYLDQKDIEFIQTDRHLDISIDEHKIPDFLNSIALKGVQYSQISIEKPTLEDYFLSLVKRI